MEICLRKEGLSERERECLLLILLGRAINLRPLIDKVHIPRQEDGEREG